ncbi:hypothetical protein K443DRAFT_553996 [Laccaria amethystina LaAM-08-1]|uniref:C2H2-type domain-containing protein n=1 Tax=Laccaria amethystina LaAM-08-1 TaxID=1095629 RepID=A0A0C9XVE9_9AGAR|nr:hypothetical protein K443DRAFT_553996 [Laccaria amethystina LaAM-08-1]
MPASRKAQAAAKGTKATSSEVPSAPAVAPPGGAVCDICNKVLSRKHDLSRHKKTHNPVKDFICGCCDRGWSNLQELNIHLDRIAGNKPHKCPFEGCEFKTADPASLTRHKKNIHKYDPQSGPGEPTSRRSAKSRQRRARKDSEESFRRYSEYYRSGCASPSGSSSASSSDFPTTPSDRSTLDLSTCIEELCLHDIGPEGVLVPWTFPWESVIEDPNFEMGSPSSCGFFLRRRVTLEDPSATPHDTHAAYDSSSVTRGHEQGCQDIQVVGSGKSEEQLLPKSSSKRSPDHIDSDLSNIHLPLLFLPYPFNTAMKSIETASSPIFNGYHHQVLQQETEVLNNTIMTHSHRHEPGPAQYYGDVPAPQEPVNFDFTPAPLNMDAAIFAQMSESERNPYALPEPTYQHLDFNLDMGMLEQNSYTSQEPTEQQFNYDFSQCIFDQNSFAPQEPSYQQFNLDLDQGMLEQNSFVPQEPSYRQFNLDLDQGMLEQNSFALQEPIYQQFDLNLKQGMNFMGHIVEQQQLQQEIPGMMANTQYLNNGYIYQ